MATVINNPSSEGNQSNMLGMVLGVILIIIVFFLFFYYGLPLIRQSTTQSVPQVNVPDKIDVNVNEGK